MSSTVRRAYLALPVTACMLLSACGGLDRVSNGIAGIVPTYRATVVQGNFISKEQVEALQPGMSRQQVAELLGTPLLTSVFHADRWEYAFTLRTQGSEPLGRKMTVFFKGDVLERHEGEEMLTEAEFAARVAAPAKPGAPVPKLEATEDQLKAASTTAPKAQPAVPAAAPVATAYPPLEAATR